MIPNSLTNAEVGIFLRAVGRQMFQRDLCFEAALDGHSEAAIREDIAGDLGVLGLCADEHARAGELLQLTGEEAIAFVEGF